MDSHSKNYHTYNGLLEKVKSELGIAADIYNNVKMQLTITHQGNEGLKPFDFIYCQICQKDKIPALLKKYKDKLPVNPKISKLIDNWDMLNISSDLLNLSVCFIPDEKHLNAASNGAQNMLHSMQSHCVNPVKRLLQMLRPIN